LPLLPDFNLWGNYYSDISFGANPIVEGDDDEKIKKRKHSLIKATYCPNENQVYLGYFLKKRKISGDINELDELFGENPVEENEEFEEYSFEKEYRYKSQPIDLTQPTPYFLCVTDEYVSYVPIKARGNMAKEDRSGGKTQPGNIRLTTINELTEYATEMREKAREDIDTR